ncbi:putative ATPase [Murinocardiopsis flavida]|uniref:Putative ATPase n=1 Tax=Murinocardiopsis flavida TaxID=645275 RepID=A0A2P8CCA1_9ACTN|nr:BTAD domain-containing putative transcriptional regulator [Murinocardiopsis flavida]PSK82591.1 putative ATPase [Murinocardiopsis flavida]
MRFSISGPLTVHTDGARAVPIGGGRLRTLLVLLLLTPGRSVGTDHLIDSIWAGAAPAGAANALQALVSRLRRTLGDTAPVVADPAGYRIGVARDRVDVWEFEDLVARARTGRAGAPDAALGDLDAALALWRGDPLADLAGSGAADGLALRLAELHRSARLERADLLLDLGRPAEALPDIASIAAAEPLREHPAELLMRALAGAGRQAEALVAFDRLRRRLADELGIDPSPRIGDLHVRVLRGEFGPRSPAGPAAPRPTVRLPQGLTSFVGRDAEVRATTEALSLGRLVTVVGPGGAGKTRVSVETGARFADGHGTLAAGGVWFVELAPLSCGTEIPAALLGTLGLRDRAAMGLPAAGGAALLIDPLERFAESVGDQPMLLILDNCEHLVAEAARIAERLLADCPRLRILATSREPLAISGERLFELPSLDLPPDGADAEDAAAYSAVRLFAERVAAVRPGFAVAPDNVADVVRVCRELDGMPLALELAAARVPAVTLPQLAARLADRFRLLTNGSRSALPRHQTLQAVVDWSWELLDGAERALLRRLSVFSGGATLDAVEAVCADGADGRVGGRDLWTTLFALVDKSLVGVGEGTGGTGPRYRMLETVRHYGAQRLAESGEDHAVRAAHAAAALRLWRAGTERLRGPDQLDWIAALRAEYDDYTAAQRFAARTGDAGLCLDLVQAGQWYWQMTDGWSEAVRWSAEALRVAGDSPPPGRTAAYAECLAAVATCDDSGSDPRPDLERALALLHDAGVDPDDHASLVYLRFYRAMLGDDVAADLDRMDAAAARRGTGEPWLTATGRLYRGMLAQYIGRTATAGQELDRALAEYRAIGDRWGQSQVLSVIAEISGLTDAERGLRLLREGAALAAEMGARDLGALFRMRITVTHAVDGRLDDARRSLAELRELVTGPRLDHLVGLAAAEVARAEGGLDRADAELARLCDSFADAAPLFRSQIEPAWRHSAARVRRDAGDWPGVRRHLAPAWRTAQQLFDRPRAAALLESVAELALGEGEPQRAARLLGMSEALRGLADTAAPDVVRLRTRLTAALGGAYPAHYAAGARLTAPEVAEEVEAWLGAPGPGP